MRGGWDQVERISGDTQGGLTPAESPGTGEVPDLVCHPERFPLEYKSGEVWLAETWAFPGGVDIHGLDR